MLICFGMFVIAMKRGVAIQREGNPMTASIIKACAFLFVLAWGCLVVDLLVLKILVDVAALH